MVYRWLLLALSSHGDRDRDAPWGSLFHVNVGGQHAHDGQAPVHKGQRKMLCILPYLVYSLEAGPC